jgi:hypothetical protein
MQGILKTIPTLMHKPRLTSMCANDKLLFNISACAPLPAFAHGKPLTDLQAQSNVPQSVMRPQQEP